MYSDPRASASKNAQNAIRILCKMYNRTMDGARCEVNSKRRVVYVLSTGHIRSSDCFEDDLLLVDTPKVPEVPGHVPPMALSASAVPHTELELFESTAGLSSDASSSYSPALSLGNSEGFKLGAGSPSGMKATTMVSSISNGKRKHKEILNDFSLLAASSPSPGPSAPIQTSSSSSQAISPKKTTKKRMTPRKKRKILTLIPDGFTVAFCAFQHAWLGVVSCQPSIEIVQGPNGPRNKMVGMYKITPVDAKGRIDSRYESKFCATPTSAFRQAYGKKFGDPVDKRRPNGRLFFGFHYIKMQQRLRSAFEHQYLGTSASLGAIKSNVNPEERKLFDRWCGELALRADTLPWTMHDSLVGNARLNFPASLESVLQKELISANKVKEITFETRATAAVCDEVNNVDLKNRSASDVIISITTCSCCPVKTYPVAVGVGGGEKLRIVKQGPPASKFMSSVVAPAKQVGAAASPVKRLKLETNKRVAGAAAAGARALGMRTDEQIAASALMAMWS